MEEPMYTEIPGHQSPGNERMTAREKKLKKELEEYRETHTKPWYICTQKPLHRNGTD